VGVCVSSLSRFIYGFSKTKLHGNGLDATEDKIGPNFSDKCASSQLLTLADEAMQNGGGDVSLTANRPLLFFFFLPFRSTVFVLAAFLEEAFFRFEIIFFFDYPSI